MTEALAARPVAGAGWAEAHPLQPGPEPAARDAAAGQAAPAPAPGPVGPAGHGPAPAAGGAAPVAPGGPAPIGAGAPRAAPAAPGPADRPLQAERAAPAAGTAPAAAAPGQIAPAAPAPVELPREAAGRGRQRAAGDWGEVVPRDGPRLRRPATGEPAPAAGPGLARGADGGLAPAAAAWPDPRARIGAGEGEGRDEVPAADALGGERGAARAEAVAGPRAEAAPVPRAELARQVAAQIAALVADRGDGTMELHLRPEELGRVSLTFSQDGGAMTVSLSADRPDTLELIRRHIDLLADDLRRAGFGSVGFSFQGGGGQGERPAAREPAQGPPPDRAAPAESQQNAGPGPASRPRAGMDLRL